MSKKTIFRTKDYVTFTEISIELEVEGKKINRIAKFKKPYEISLKSIFDNNVIDLTTIFFEIVASSLPHMDPIEAFKALKKVNGFIIDHKDDVFVNNPFCSPVINTDAFCAILGHVDEQVSDLELDLTDLLG